MKISRHIYFVDNPVRCWRGELKFDPPVEVASTLGKVEAIYTGVDPAVRRKQSTGRACKPIINANGLLHIREVMHPGEVLSIDIRAGYCLNSIVCDPAHQLQILAAKEGLLYWFTIGKDGVLELTGQLVRDKDGFFSKLNSNLKDPNLRAYLVQRSLADSKTTDKAIKSTPDLMNTREAADYLRMAPSTLYKKSQSGEIHRTRNKKFHRDELDRYLRGDKKRK
ncbi:helix-turn-helix domain-containing protein [bacterium]|nr:helix-turn-helix domain-containing protein [bacterium]